MSVRMQTARSSALLCSGDEWGKCGVVLMLSIIKIDLTVCDHNCSLPKKTESYVGTRLRVNEVEK